MRSEEKTNVRNSVSRMIVVVLSILIQIGWLCLLVIGLNQHSAWISLASSLLAALMVLHIYVSRKNAAFKMPWIILLLLFPPLGVMLYGMFGSTGATAAIRKRYQKVQKEYAPLYARPDDALRAVESRDPAAANQMRYLRDYAVCPVFEDTSVEY